METYKKYEKWILLFILAVTWGTSFILIQKSVHYFSPMQVGALRVAIAGLVLLPIGLKNIKHIPKNVFPWIVLSGLLGNFIPMFLFPIAETHISSSLAGILNSLVPVFVVVLGFIFLGIKSKPLQILGAILGFLGAFILIYFSKSTSESIKNDTSTVFFYSSMAIIATITYASNALLIKKKLTGIPTLKLSSALFTLYFLPSIFILFFTDFHTVLPKTKDAIHGVGYVSILAIFGTALATILFNRMIQISSTVFASSVTYLMPIVALFWGIAAGEAISFIHFIGMTVILLGVYLIQEKKK